MNKIINIDGIDYIQKAEYDKAQNDINNIKKMASSLVADLSAFVDNQPTIEVVPKKEENTRTNEVYSKRSPQLKIRVAGQKLYKIGHMDKDGKFYSKSNRKFIFTIKDVIAINKEYAKGFNKKDALKISRQNNIPVDTVHRIIYNIDANIFDQYLKEYFSDVNNKEIKHKTIEVQNNPQKRKEAGIYN